MSKKKEKLALDCDGKELRAHYWVTPITDRYKRIHEDDEYQISYIEFFGTDARACIYTADSEFTLVPTRLLRRLG